MDTFKIWLSHALSCIDKKDFLYKERLSAFHKITMPCFLEYQKERYVYISLKETLDTLSKRAYNHTVEPINRGVVMDNDTHSDWTIRLTFVDGIWSCQLSNLEKSNKAVILKPVKALSFIEQNNLWQEYKKTITKSYDIFELLHTLLVREIYLLEIPDHTKALHINIQHILTEQVHHVVPCLIIKVGLSSNVTITERWTTMQGAMLQFSNSLTYVVLDKEACLTFYKLPSKAPLLRQINTLHCKQQAFSTFNHYNFSFGAPRLRLNLKTKIQGSHAVAKLYGLYVIGSKDKLDQSVQVVHNHPHSFSRQYYKGIVGGQAIAVFNGLIHLTPEAQKTNAYQMNKAILVSKQAAHYAKPQLEIYVDDVKCSHGATLGQLDQSQLFYMQTRGLTCLLAKQLLLQAFGQEIIDKVPLEALKYDLLLSLSKELEQC